MRHPRYEEFTFTTEFDPEVIASAAEETRELFYARTGAGDIVDQKLAVHLTIPEGVDRNATPIVRLPAWSDDNGRLEGGYFDALIAHATGRPVLAPNAPGVDFSEWRDATMDEAYLMAPDQKEELRKRGSFKKAGAAVMNALNYASAEFGLSGEYILHSSSMGVALGGAAIAAASDRIRGLVLSEGVNYSERGIPLLRLPTLGLQFGLQNRYAAGYLEQNPPIIPDEEMSHWLDRTKEAWPANWSYIQGLKRGNFLKDAGDLSSLAERDVPVFMTRGTISTLANARAHQNVLQTFKTSGVNVWDKQYEGHDHPYTMTVQSVVEAVKEVA